MTVVVSFLNPGTIYKPRMSKTFTFRTYRVVGFQIKFCPLSVYYNKYRENVYGTIYLSISIYLSRLLVRIVGSAESR